MEQKPAGDNPGDAQQQPEIILSSSAPAGIEPAPNRVCPKCGTVNPPPAVYCYKCGLKLPDASIPDKKICPGCRTPNALTSQYCYKCGLQLTDKPGSSYENTLRYGGFWVRFVASIIDGILLYVLSIIIAIFIYIGLNGPSSESSLLSAIQSSNAIDNSIVSSFIGLVFLTGLIATIVYSTIAVGIWGRTIGKAALRLKVVKPDGSRVSYWRAFGRSLAYILNWFIFGLGFLVIAFTSKKRGLHDYICDTIVVKTD